MMQDKTLQRIDEVLDLYGSNRTRLASKMGMAQSTLNSIYQRGNTKAIQTVAESVLGIYADVRREWLIDGHEPMLKSQLDANGLMALHQTIRNLSETVKAQQEMIDRLLQSQKKTAEVA